MQQNPNDSVPEAAAKQPKTRPSLFVRALNFTTACLLVSLFATYIGMWVGGEPDSIVSYLSNMVDRLSFCCAGIGLVVAAATYIPWKKAGR